MKKTLLTMLALVSGILLLAGTAVQAQSSGTNRASIPFEFSLTSATLPAGDYTIQTVNSRTILLRGADNRSHAYVLTSQTVINVEQDSSRRLVFHRYGSSYFLSEIWMSESRGVILARSKQERSIAKELAKLNQRAQSVEIAVTR